MTAPLNEPPFPPPPRLPHPHSPTPPSDTFDVGGVHDGKVTKDEWKTYYDNVSMSIDDDDYFELMIRNTWHISGGEGWCANSSNKRVLVTRSDGSQSVEEVSLGVAVCACLLPHPTIHISDRRAPPPHLADPQRSRAQGG